MRHVLAVLLVAGGASFGILHAQEGPYRFTREILVGGVGGWDYLSVDAAAHRLYVSHATKIVLVDTQANHDVRGIAHTLGVHRFVGAAALGRGISSNRRQHKV